MTRRFGRAEIHRDARISAIMERYLNLRRTLAALDHADDNPSLAISLATISTPPRYQFGWKRPASGQNSCSPPQFTRPTKMAYGYRLLLLLRYLDGKTTRQASAGTPF